MNATKIATILIILLITSVLFVLFINDGMFIYSLDDAYIHLAISKNLAEYGVWGVTKYEFSSSSSSPLLTVMLSSMIYIFGDWQFHTLILNSILSILLIPIILSFNREFFENEKQIGFLTLVQLLAVPVIIIAFTGMEHILHIIFVLLFLTHFIRYLKNNSLSILPLYILSALMVATRYESIFMVGIVGLYFLYSKRYIDAVVIVLSGLSLISIFGLYSIANGNYFFPNSLLIKGNYGAGTFDKILSYTYRWLVLLSERKHFLTYFLPILISSIFLLKTQKKSAVSIFSLIIMLSVMAQLTFADIGWLFRYESYLVVPIITISYLTFLKVRDNKFNLLNIKPQFTKVLIIVFLAAFALRTSQAYKKGFYSNKNIYEQQYHTAQFLKEFYPDSRVLTYDIGAVCYFTDIHLLDYAGLGNTSLVKTIKNGDLDSNFSKAMTTEYDIAILSPKHPHYLVPIEWQLVGSTEIYNNHISIDEVVYFFALSANPDSLRSNFEKFSGKLPPRVKYRIN